MSHTAPPPCPTAPEDEEAREMAAFFRAQDPVDVLAAEWHTRREQGLAPGEDAQLRQWLAASPAHAAAFERLDQSMALLRSLPADALAAAARPAPHAPRRAAPARAWRLPRPALAAACGVAMLAAGLGWHQWQAWQQPTFTHGYATQTGQRLDATLPDGSKLLIDAGTRASVALYRDRREVRMEQGQALFQVAPDSERPFVVQAGPARVTVVGTRFSVRYRQDGTERGQVSVAVEEGRVRVAAADTEATAAPPVELAAGQGVQVSPGGAVGAVAELPPGTVAPWRKGMVFFQNTALGDALRELERYGPTGLVVRDPAVAALPVGGSYRLDRPADFARVLPHILPVRLVAGADGTTEIARR